MEINLAMFTVYKWQSIKFLWSKCKSNFWDFSIFTTTSKMALQRKQRRNIHRYWTNCLFNRTHKFLHWEWICLNVFRLAQSKCKHVSPTVAGKVSHISNFHYWKHPKNIQLKLKRIEKNVTFTLWYVWYPHVTTLGVCNRVRSRSKSNNMPVNSKEKCFETM